MDEPPTTSVETPLSDALPAAIYSTAQVREFDRLAIEQLAIPGYELMCRAGRGALAVLLRRWPMARRLLVYCGAGNNAGDGYVLARLAARQGYAVRVVAVIPPQRLGGDAARAWVDCREAGVPIESFEAHAGTVAPFMPEIVADALLGTGADRLLEGELATAVEHINRSACPVLALDIPSGLDADDGRVLGVAVRADATVTFVGLKQGLFLGAAPDLRGELEFCGLDLPATIADAGRAALQRLTFAWLRERLRPRPRSAHKGTHGRLLLVGGGAGMSGAIRLAAEAALRAGAGLVYVATHPDSQLFVATGRPELMCHGVNDPAALDPLLAMADAVVIGPGLGRGEWAIGLFERVLASSLPLVIDADALNLLAERPQPRAAGGWILTPHPGEAARLVGCSATEIQADRLGAVQALASEYRATVVLKGACTLVATVNEADGEGVLPAVCDRGNPGMASAGMGDVLAGVIGGLQVQINHPADAARAGVFVHALAGDDAAKGGERGTLALDLMPAIRRWVNPV